MLMKYADGGYVLSLRDKENLLETFRSHYDESGRLVKDSEDDESTKPEDKKLLGPSGQMMTMQVQEINKKFITLNAFIKSRDGTRTKAV